RDLAHPHRKRSPEHALNEEEEKVPAVEHRDRQEIQEAEVDAQKGDSPDEVVGALPALTTGELIDRDWPAHLFEAEPTLEKPDEGDPDESSHRDRLLDSLGERVADRLGVVHALFEGER